MKKLILLSLTLTMFQSFGQELSCKDFHEGTFIAEVTEPVKATWKILRVGNSQAEFAMESIGSELPVRATFGIIEWIDECTYNLKYDPTKSELLEEQKMINKLGGFDTEMVKIEGNCIHFKTTLKFNEHERSIRGKFCKE